MLVAEDGYELERGGKGLNVGLLQPIEIWFSFSPFIYLHYVGVFLEFGSARGDSHCRKVIREDCLCERLRVLHIAKRKGGS
jgi:hypothetical protein